MMSATYERQRDLLKLRGVNVAGPIDAGQWLFDASKMATGRELEEREPLIRPHDGAKLTEPKSFETSFSAKCSRFAQEKMMIAAFKEQTNVVVVG